MSTWNPLQIPRTRATLGGEGGDGGHDRREPGDGARAQVVAVGEPARHDDGVDLAERVVAVPAQPTLAADGLDGLDDVVLAVGPRKDDDPDRRTHDVSG